MTLRRIVVRLPNWLGDGVMAVPALRALRRRFPDAELLLHGRPLFEPLLGDSDLFDRFLPLAERYGRGTGNVEVLRAEAADAVVVLPHSFRSAHDPWRARVPIRIGYAREGRGPLLTHALSPHRWGNEIIPVPMQFQYLELVAVLGATGGVEDCDLGVGAEAEEAAEEWLVEHGLGVGEKPLAINPGASFGPSKVYPPELLAVAAECAIGEGWGPILILCGPGEESLATDVAMRIPSPVVTAAEHPPSLDVLKGILRRCRALITTDAGPRHLATSLGVPTVVLMGPTDPRFTAARLERAAILRRDVPCGPCHEKVCPLDHRCMREIPPREIVKALAQVVPIS